MLAYTARAERSFAEIFSIWTDGSHRRQLTSNGGYNPAWSPDGTQIAYESRDGIHLMSSAGAAQQQVAEGTDPAWAPDGRSLSYGCGDGKLCILDLVSRQESVVVGTDSDWLAVGSMDWSPDRSWIVFTRFSVDGDDYTRYRQLFVVRPDGTGLTAIPNTYPEGTMPTWSPDGSSILYTERYDGRGGQGSGDLFTISPDGSNRTQVTDTIGDDHDASWSPDGTLFAMQSDAEYYPEKAGIWVVTLDGRRDFVVCNGWGPSWRPGWTRPPTPPPNPTDGSGSRIAYVARTEAGFDVFTVRPDGTGRRRRTSTGDVRALAWSPDHSRIAYFRDVYPTVWILNIRSGVSRRIAAARNAEGALDWSPDGRRLAWGGWAGLKITTCAPVIAGTLPSAAAAAAAIHPGRRVAAGWRSPRNQALATPTS